ncbi:MAG: GspE/PulE family protein [Candidatus Sumerlaeia bacterium]|nr:GspE/PulE family protein [Candidatus Sumerlaeia bacterium]
MTRLLRLLLATMLSFAWSVLPAQAPEEQPFGGTASLQLGDGTRLEGRVVWRDGSTLVLDTADGGRRYLPAAQVRRAGYPDPATPPSEAPAVLAAARESLAAGNEADAVRLFFLFARLNETAARGETAVAGSIAQAALARASALHTNGQRDQAIQLLWPFLSPTGTEVLRNAMQPSRSELEAVMNPLAVEWMTEEANALRESDPAGRRLEELLREVSRRTPVTDPSGQLARIYLAQNLAVQAIAISRPENFQDVKDEAARQRYFALFRESLAIQEEILAAPRLATEFEIMAKGGVDFIRERVRFDEAAATPEATTAPPPSPAAEQPPAATPAEPAAQQPVADAPPPASGSGAKLLKAAGVDLSPEDAEAAVRIGLIASAVILVVWLLPWVFLRFFEYQGNIYAANRRQQVWSRGPFAVLLFMRDSAPKRQPTPDHACPHCSGSLDNPENYPDLNFAKCPNCGQPVQPVHTLDGYLRQISDNLRVEAERVERGAMAIQDFVKTNRMERLIQTVLADSIRRRASDLHLEPEERGLKVRQRVDGIMLERLVLPRALSNSVVSAFKARANMDVADRLRPQDGSFTHLLDDAKIDMRVASSPSANGEKLTIRFLDVRSIQTDPRKLGMTASQRDAFERSTSSPHGLVLVTGPTGSGKTTTLYVALQRLRDQDKNIISIEDPIEFRLSGINQIQVNPQAGLTFASGLRSILRQDPDVIMIGEIRDKETAEIAIEAATTGHLVFSTLHTIDSAAAMARLMEFQISARRFADSLNLIASQRLCRLVCPDCRKMKAPTADEIAAVGLSDVADVPSVVPYPVGCSLCNNSGYFGRTGLFEMLIATDDVRSALEHGNMSTVEIRNLAVQHGMLTIRQHGHELLRKGLTTIEELVRVTR